MTEAPDDPHLAARGTYVTADGVVQPAPAPRFGDGTQGAPIGALPPGRITHAGAHTREVLTALGFADVEELLVLRRRLAGLTASCCYPSTGGVDAIVAQQPRSNWLVAQKAR